MNSYHKLIILLLLLTSSVSVFAAMTPENNTITQKETNGKQVILNSSLQKAKALQEEYLISDTTYSRVKANYKYNEIIEKQLLLLIKESFNGNEAFYYDLFSMSQKNIYGKDLSLDTLIATVPKIKNNLNISKILFNKSLVSDQLLDASFGVDYQTKYSYSSLIGTIERKITDFERMNGYYPSETELGELLIYHNGEEVSISDVLLDFNYSVNNNATIYSSIEIDEKLNVMKDNVKISLNDTVMKEFEKDMTNLKSTSGLMAQTLIKKYDKYYKDSYKRVYKQVSDGLKEIYFSDITYTLTYKKIELTLQEALEDIDKVGVAEVVFKDYKKLIGDAEMKEIPEIYKKIPNDSIFFHVNNPEFLFKLLDSRDELDTSGIEILKKVKDLIVDKSGLENYDEIKNNIKHDFIVVFSDIDLVSPNMLIILDKRDKGVLTPGDSAKAAVTIDDHIFIANSKKLLEGYQELNESDSIYNSDDFKYVWMRKQNVTKDIFFFAGDKFFAKIVDFEHFIKMKRKINDYVNLTDLQTFVYAFQKNSGDVINDFNEINKILKIDEEKLSNYSVKNSVVTHNKIGKLSDILNIDEIDYNLNNITREELVSYKSNILKYKDVWNAYLDPLGIIFSELNDGFKIDLFMTPIPKFADSDLETMKKLFEDTGINSLDFLENEKLRNGAIGGILGLDINAIEEKIKSPLSDKENNRDLYYLNQGIEEFEKEILGGENLGSFLGGEFMLSLGGIDHSIFNSYDMEKLDLFFAVEFESKLKAKEMIKLVREKIAEEFIGNSRGVENKVYGNLIKPLSEIYNDETIYIIPNVDLYFIQPSFYYVLLDNYFYVSISKSTIQKTIDDFTSGSKSKTKFINNALDGKKIFYAFLDGDTLEKVSDDLMGAELIVDLYLDIKSGSYYNTNPLLYQISKFYRDIEYSKIKGKEIPTFNEKIGILELYNIGDIIYLRVDRNSLKIENLDIKPELDKILDSLDAKYFSGKGGDIAELLKDSSSTKSKKLDELFTISLLNMLLDTEYRNSFFTNMSLSFDISDDEIQMQMNSFSSDSNDSSSMSKGIDNITDTVQDLIMDTEGTNNNTILYIIISVLITIISGGIFVFIRKKQKPIV